jgi:hypothetical protein
MAVLPRWLFVSFISHCARRAIFVQRIMCRRSGFDEMLSCLTPIAARTDAQSVPERWIYVTADVFARMFPWLWRRRCLFRSLLVLDWAHGLGMDPTLNVGIKLGEHRAHGHCWLSIGGQPFCEPGGWPKLYRKLFYQDNRIQHWATLTQNLDRVKNQEPKPKAYSR